MQCQREFEEKDNFNWSCCFHQSNYGGQMWWCCGKTKKNAPGCRFTKHQVSDLEKFMDSDNEEEEHKRVKP